MGMCSPSILGHVLGLCPWGVFEVSWSVSSSWSRHVLRMYSVVTGSVIMCPRGARECGLCLFWGVFSMCHGVGFQAVVRISLKRLGMCPVCPGMCPGFGVSWNVSLGCVLVSRKLSSGCVLRVSRCVSGRVLRVSLRWPRVVLECVLGLALACP